VSFQQCRLRTAVVGSAYGAAVRVCSGPGVLYLIGRLALIARGVILVYRVTPAWWALTGRLAVTLGATSAWVGVAMLGTWLWCR
jgi:hypothetical protein